MTIAQAFNEIAAIGELNGSEVYFVMPDENCVVFYASID